MSWRGHYDRLHLHTVKEQSALPGMPFDASVPRYPSRADVVAYLERYASHFEIVAQTGEGARRVRKVDGAFEVETSGGVRRADVVVMAAGYNRVPNPDRLPRQDEFEGSLVHSARYANGAPYAGKRVLVVGAGNTGAEIALDLLDHGAKPTLAVRSPVNIIPRDFLGMPTQLTSIRLRHLPVKIVDSIGRAVGRLAFGDLARFGFGRPDLGPLSAIRTRKRIPLIDIGTIDAIKRGAIAVKPGVTHFARGGAAFADASEENFDAVVLATGYRPALAEIVDVPGALDAEGYPRGWQSEGAAQGIYFVGYRNVATGLLREIALESEAVASAVVSN
jgi:hypothetical protein